MNSQISELKSQIDYIKNRITALDTEQSALKILANSGYGSIGNPYFRYFQLENAEAITLTGQFVIRYIDTELNKFLTTIFGTQRDRVIISDTDSVVVELSDVFKDDTDLEVSTKIDILNTFAETQVQPKIQKIIKNIEFLLNAIPGLLSMKREIIANKTIAIAKKRYIMNVFDKEGVRFKEPKKKIMGIEAVKSSTPSLCKSLIKKTLDMFFTSDNEHLLSYVDSCCTEVFTETDLSAIAFPRGVQNLEEYKNSSKSVPIHVSASLAFNRFIEENKLTYKYELIKSGEKIKFCYLKQPNPFHCHVMGWNTSSVPKELELEDYIDRQRQFQIGYLNPIESIIEAIGWQKELNTDLNDLF